MLQSVLLEALSGCDDVVVTVGGLDVAPRAGEVDVVLTAAPDPGNVEPLMDWLWRWPKSRIIVIATGGRQAAMYELFPRKRILGELCPQTLVDAVCAERR